MDLFHYYLQYRILVCKSCQYAIQPNCIIAHLRSDQHKLPRQQSEEIANQYKNYDLADPCIEHIIPQTTILPIDYLPIYRDGLACSHCQYVCRSERWIKQHQREVHNIRIEEDGDLDLLAGQLHGANASLLVQVSITLRCKIRQL